MVGRSCRGRKVEEEKESGGWTYKEMKRLREHKLRWRGNITATEMD